MTRSRAIFGSMGLLLAVFCVNLLADRRTPAKPGQRTAVDSSAVVTLRDTVRVMDSASRRSLDSMRIEFKRRPIRDVVRYLPGHVDTDTVLIVDSVTVPQQVIRETADSFATCRHDRDSLTRDGSLWKARTAAQDEARRLCEAKPVPVQPEPPSRALWASVGASAAFLSILSVFILSR